MELQWALGNYGRRFSLIDSGDATRSIYGVYLVYHDGNTVRPLLIGHGNIREHLGALGSDPDLMVCSVLGLLRATWAAVPEHYAEGITKFLADQLDPIIKPILQSAASVAVNLPREEPVSIPKPPASPPKPKFGWFRRASI